ncbi:MAG: hypothetical protein ACJ8E1_13630 [Xanthobacteraceae bacterium]
MDRPLEKPDAAHPQRQRAEVVAQRVMSVVWGSYAVMAVVTLMFQIVIRLQECVGPKACAVSLAKAVPWSVGWPFYWAFYLNG